VRAYERARSLQVGTFPALIAAVGNQARMRFLEFFTANIRNVNTRRSYATATAEFLVWCQRATAPLANFQTTTMIVTLQIADGPRRVDAEDRLHKLVNGGPTGERLNSLSHEVATYQVHDSGLMVALCRQAGVNSDAAFIR
jgi:hypothetical protein